MLARILKSISLTLRLPREPDVSLLAVKCLASRRREEENEKADSIRISENISKAAYLGCCSCSIAFILCHSTWVDDAQDKEYWYRTSNNTITEKEAHIDVHSSYDLIKSLKDNTLDKDELIQITRKYTANIISAAEQYIKIFREYLNNTITEEELIDSVAPLNIEISKWFLKQSDLPIPPKKLHDWAHIHTKLSCTIHDFSLFYDKKNLKTWKSENRKWLLQNAIKQYEMELEELKTAYKLI